MNLVKLKLLFNIFSKPRYQKLFINRNSNDLLALLVLSCMPQTPLMRSPRENIRMRIELVKYDNGLSKKVKSRSLKAFNDFCKLL